MSLASPLRRLPLSRRVGRGASGEGPARKWPSAGRVRVVPVAVHVPADRSLMVAALTSSCWGRLGPATINFWGGTPLLIVRIYRDGRGNGRTAGLVPEAGRGEDVRTAGVRPVWGALQFRGSATGDAGPDVPGLREPRFAPASRLGGILRSKATRYYRYLRRGVAQLVEHRPPNPSVAGSSPATPARRSSRSCLRPSAACRRARVVLRMISAGPGGGTADTLS